MSPDTIPRVCSAAVGANAVVSEISRPRMSTPAVWVIVTVAPTVTTSRSLPLRPTRYAAMIVLPWPGRNACPAPSVVSLKSLGGRVRDNVVCELPAWDCWTGTVNG